MNMWGQPPPAVQASEARPLPAPFQRWKRAAEPLLGTASRGRLSLDKTYDPARATGIRLLSTGTSR
jgi:hypothetical protein